MPSSYFTTLRKGRIENPGNEKMLAIARAMGFPPALWFEDAPTEGRGLAARVQSHFKIIVHPGTGDSYTDAEAVRMGAGVLTEEEVEGIRTGKIADPTVGQVAASRPPSVPSPPISWIWARTLRSSTRKRSTPWRTRPRTPYSGRAPAYRRGRSGSCSGKCGSLGTRVRHQAVSPQRRGCRDRSRVPRPSGYVDGYLPGGRSENIPLSSQV